MPIERCQRKQGGLRSSRDAVAGFSFQSCPSIYRGDAHAIADGKKLCTSNCIVCHGADGTGKIGPTIVGKDVVYKQVLTDPGMFAIIYGEASDARSIAAA
jgi:mono/diheme cytochrome c family protein